MRPNYWYLDNSRVYTFFPDVERFVFKTCLFSFFKAVRIVKKLN